MSNDSEKSLLLGNRVYARGSDGLHHACAVQGKKDNYYVIKFPDGSTKLECENDLTWLGFRGLPKSLWPKQPTVLVDGNSVKDEIKCFAGRAGKGGTNMLTNLRPRMLRLVRGGIVSLNDQEKTLRCSDPESRTQTRSSVLRLHPDLLEKKGARCEMKIISTISDDQTSSRNGWSSKAVSKSRAIMKTRSKVYDVNGSSNVTEQRNDTTIQIDIPEIALSESHITPVLEQNFKDTQLRLFDGTDLANEAFCDLTSPNLLAAWQPGPWHEPLTFELSPLSPPITPRPPNVSITLDCPPFETFYDSLPSESTFPIENTQLFEELVSGKRSKREMPKKCRKVYGIDNKKAWCTQCRWKKACTRFSS